MNWGFRDIAESEYPGVKHREGSYHVPRLLLRSPQIVSERFYTSLDSTE
jgi:hypothetical protein